MRFWILFGLLLAFCNTINGEENDPPLNPVAEVLSQCCISGEDVALKGDACANIKPPLDIVPEDLISSCFFSSEICCASKVRIEQCKHGVLAAKDGLDCHENGTDYYTGCCESCKIGLVIGDRGGDCSLKPFGWGIPFDDSFHYCCTMGTFVLDENKEKDLCNSFDRLCSQICENTDDSYICKCNPGFELLEDRITCVPKANDLASNEVYTNSTDDCDAGYIKNEQSGECEDIDECESGDATCDMSSQVCYNTLGNYKCLDIIQSPSVCSDGFRYNAKTESCDDINECLEEIDNCNATTQICLNTRGNFVCQNKVSEECLPGFKYDKNKKTCQDINECETERPCGKGMDCINTAGGFDCRPSRTTKKYDKNIDECALDRNACDSNQVCTNLAGGFQCDCKIGFTLDKVTNACVDVNECQINNHDCLETQRCDNTIGSYTCIRLQSCGTGYTLNAGTGFCDDDDECALGRHNCVAPYECRNTKGSFRCDRPRYTYTPSVPATTIWTTTTTTTHRPPSHTAYVPPQVYRYNTPNPYETTVYNRNSAYDRYSAPCDVGFMRNVQGACVDVDECYMGNPCKRNQRCFNTNGSYKCQSLLTCSGGYTSNDEGTQCIGMILSKKYEIFYVTDCNDDTCFRFESLQLLLIMFCFYLDIDECATNENSCAPDQTCRNKQGGYTCFCQPGHEFNKNSHRCEDINECEQFKGQVCPANTECHNTIGSYNCECLSGFRKINRDDKVCIDVDECKDIPGLCQQRCNNYWGSYRCSCESGFRLNENNRTCDDVNECEVHKTYNLCMGICENTQGSYKCTCPPGYKLGVDGRTCQDIDECLTLHACNTHNEICTNTRGSYRCTQINCPSDFMIDPEKKNRCKRISLYCDQQDTECFQRPSSYSYNFITLVANLALPPQGRTFFNLKGPHWYENIDFELKVVRTQPHVQNVNERFFSMHKMNTEVLLSLMEVLKGPQDIELELKMTVFRNGQPAGTNVAKIFIFVSQYSY
ncbi:Fibulin-1 [Pseudolycoriella hygida]|uniref:Fibulin-1 n=1 Tax=Pseudolycoriella hygida TaxID=35572 RepID=A0A9Q0NBM7_9DIPT|nr:Fibulin-1 [Pseudolycoriella hygida]